MRAEVVLWGRRIGAVLLPEGDDVAVFEYEPAFARSGIQPSPLMMPTEGRRFAFPALPRASFRGLPGLLADALPDRYGNELINAWLARQGRTPGSFSSVERLCYTGSRGLGALEFIPATGPATTESEALDVAALHALAGDVLARRIDLSVDLEERTRALQQLLRVGTSAGGARAKAVVAWNPTTNEVRSGQVPTDAGFEHWLLKFDGVAGNRDKELEDPAGFGAIELAYHRLARAAGIDMTDCRLLNEGGRRHFMTRRFDRTAEGRKLHMQSLAAMAHLDFNQAGAHSYEQAFLLIRRLDLGMDALEEQFRRMAFNVVARNQDDHVKNIAFLMDRAGRWSLSPAFDVTFSFNPSGAWTSRHQMTLNGKRDGFTRDDFRGGGRTISLKRGRADTLLDRVLAAVRTWPDVADDLAIPGATIAGIKNVQRLDL
jgi:serine/threonine-protein kinase HipA